MGYFKTLTIEPSAACEYSRRWAQNDQVEGRINSHLAGDRVGYKNTTIATIAPAVSVAQTQSDQVGDRNNTHLASNHGESNPTTATTKAPGMPPVITREHVGRALYA